MQRAQRSGSFKGTSDFQVLGETWLSVCSGDRAVTAPAQAQEGAGCLEVGALLEALCVLI